MNFIRFTTLYPECGNIELTKDVGQIPYVLGNEHYEFNTTLVGCNINLNGENISNVKGLQIHKLKRIINNNISGALYILRHAKDIDCLNVYHAGRRSLYWMRLYKLLNHKGKTYLKLDMDFRSCDMYDNDKWERKIFILNTNIADYVSVESNAVKNRIQKYSKKDIHIISNGYCKLNYEYAVDNKQNIFLTVGRLGTTQKATEILLEAFARTAVFHNWKLVLIGSVESSFIPVIDTYFTKYPHLKERVQIEGVINKREQLYQQYNMSRVFVLPSRWEGFALVGGEALSCGCRMIVSDKVPPFREMTNNGLFGEVVESDNIESLADAMLYETRREYNRTEMHNIREYAKNEFSWSRICDKLSAILEDR